MKQSMKKPAAFLILLFVLVTVCYGCAAQSPARTSGSGSGALIQPLRTENGR